MSQGTRNGNTLPSAKEVWGTFPKVQEIEEPVRRSFIPKRLKHWIQLLRWNKPSGRLILLIPSGWSLWLTPNAPPQGSLVALIIVGGLFVSGAGCIANDLWDRKIDQKVDRTKQRPLASGTVRISTAFNLLFLMLLLSLLVAKSLPLRSQGLCLALALISLPPILIYPSAKRWFAYPQAILAICWGFAVLIPWAASQSNLAGGWPLLGVWLATLMWTFGFDTVYAMADRVCDKNLGIQSSALSLGKNAVLAVAWSYALACTFLSIAALIAGVGWPFWPVWLLASCGMQREAWAIGEKDHPISFFGSHFQNQVALGSLLLLGLILGRMA